MKLVLEAHKALGGSEQEALQQTLSADQMIRSTLTGQQPTGEVEPPMQPPVGQGPQAGAMMFNA